MQIWSDFKGFLINILPCEGYEYKEFGKFKLTKSDVFKNFDKFPDLKKKPFCLTFVILLSFSWLFLISWLCGNPEQISLYSRLSLAGLVYFFMAGCIYFYTAFNLFLKFFKGGLCNNSFNLCKNKSLSSAVLKILQVTELS